MAIEIQWRGIFKCMLSSLQNGIEPKSSALVETARGELDTALGAGDVSPIYLDARYDPDAQTLVYSNGPHSNGFYLPLLDTLAKIGKLCLAQDASRSRHTPDNARAECVYRALLRRSGC